MALIGKIREKSTLLLIVIGVGMLLFIAPYEQIISLFGSGQNSNSIGMFKGEPIYSEQWRFEDQVNRLKFQYRQNQQEVPDDYARNAIFNQMINDSLLNTELNILGLFTTPDELSAIQDGADGVAIADYIKNLPHFQDENKQFSKDSLIQKLQYFANQDGGYWEQIEAELSRSNIIAKYVSMISKGVIVTDYEAQRDFNEANEKVNLQYVYKAFNTVPDSVINITDGDYSAYYEKHKGDKKYEKEETRGIDFVSINVIPSSEDSAFIRNQIEQLKESFASVRPENDSLYVLNNSDESAYNGGYRQPNEFPLAIDTLIQQAEVGSVVGPFQLGTSYQLAKILESKMEPEAKVRHILCGFGEDQSDENKNKAKLRADSVLRVLRLKNNFEELLAVSDDPGKTQNNGEYGPFDKDAQLVEPFKDFAFANAVGQTGVVETNFGYHVMEVLERNDSKRIIAPTIQKNIIPLDKTIGMYKDSAYRFIQAAKGADDFGNYCKENGFFFGVTSEKDIVVSAPQMKSPDLANNNNILKWVFNAEMNEISDYFYMNNSHKLIVAKITQKIAEGSPSLESSKTLMHDDLVNEKKALYLTEQANDVVTLNDVLIKWQATTVLKGRNVAFKNKNLSDVTSNDQREEGIVVGTAFTMHPGVLSAPIAGSGGMYVLLVDQFIPVAEKKENYDFERTSLQENLRSRADGGIMKGLRDVADIKDYRKKRELINE